MTVIAHNAHHRESVVRYRSLRGPPFKVPSPPNHVTVLTQSYGPIPLLNTKLSINTKLNLHLFWSNSCENWDFPIYVEKMTGLIYGHGLAIR